MAVGPAGIPAVTVWGLAVLALLVLFAGTILLRRALRRAQPSASREATLQGGREYARHPSGRHALFGS